MSWLTRRPRTDGHALQVIGPEIDVLRRAVIRNTCRSSAHDRPGVRPRAAVQHILSSRSVCLEKDLAGRTGGWQHRSRLSRLRWDTRKINTLDLRTQSKSIDFSGVPTKTTQTGTVLPATCSTGQIFFKTDAPGGENMLYGCTGTNTWTIMSGASAGIPYNGATQDVDLGAYNLKSMAVSTGTPGQPTHLDMTKGLCPSTASTGYDVTLCVDADGKTKIVRSDGT